MNHRHNIGEYLTSLGLINKGVEVGVFKGDFSKEILSKWPGTLYMVDPWRPLGDEYIDSSNHKNHSTAYSETMGSIGGFEDRAIMVRALSEQAVDLFEDDSLDFVYLDGNHAYDFIKQDIELWYPKVKKGGLVAGHDYLGMDWYGGTTFLANGKDKHIYSNNGSGPMKYAGIFGVNPAVDEFCKDNNYEVNLNNEAWFDTWWFIKQ
jgi:hypothetical protein